MLLSTCNFHCSCVETIVVNHFYGEVCEVICFSHVLTTGCCTLKSQAPECEPPLLQPQSVAVRLRGYEHLLHLAARNGSSLVVRGRPWETAKSKLCRWKKSCTRWYVVTGFSHFLNFIYRVSTIQGSVGLLPSTVWNFWHQKMSENACPRQRVRRWGPAAGSCI
jgi:hypothetical protein